MTTPDKFKISRLIRVVDEPKPTVFNDSGRVYQALLMLDDVIVQGNAKMLPNLEWLWKSLTHRDASIRILAYQIASVLAVNTYGASLLLQNTELWNQFMDIILDRTESYSAKENAMTTLTHLLKLVLISYKNFKARKLK